MARPMRRTKANADLHGSAPDHCDTAVVLLDLISDFEFADGLALLRGATRIAPIVRRLKHRAASAGVPVIYVNDNFGRWRSSFEALVRHCSRETARGSAITRMLQPSANDYCVLKPKHSGFFATPLATLLDYLGVRRLVLTGLSSHQCVLFTANDAYVRDFELVIPRDCICAPTAGETRFALRYFTSVLNADVRKSAAIRFGKRRKRLR